MKTLFFCLLSLFCLQLCEAQKVVVANLNSSNDFPEIRETKLINEFENTKTINYLDYYKSIALAEEAVVNNNFGEAVSQYFKIFDNYSYNNPIDCYVAAQVAGYINDTFSCNTFLIKGICYGLPIFTIVSNPHLYKYSTLIKQNSIDSCLKIHKNKINAKARFAIISLIQRDQNIVHNLPPMAIYESDGFTLKEQFRPIWDSLLAAVMKITEEYGFPAQKVVGTQSGADSLFRIGPNAVFALPIFQHHGNSWGKVGTKLWNELLKGNITPQMYGVIYESSKGKSNNKDSIIYFASRFCAKKNCKKIIRQKLNEINKARWNIGLCSYEVMQRKFVSRYNYFKWRRKKESKPKPFFDFECELNFQLNTT